MLTLLFSACSNKATFEWIKINPDKIKEANTRVAYRNGIRNIDLTLDLKEKSIPIYYESPEAFEAGNSTPLIITKPKVVSKTREKSKINTRQAIAANKTVASKPAYPKPATTPVNVATSKPAFVKKLTAPKPEKVADSVTPDEERITSDKLNGALKIPKKPIKQIISAQKEVTPQIKKEVKSADDKNNKVKDFLNERKGNNFILAGAALAVIGMVLGLIFGKSAYLISGAGIIFAAVGFILRF